MKQVTPILKLCSRSFPLGVGEGATYTSNLHASQYYAGIFNAFLTFAPFDVLDALVQRYCQPSTCNTVHPAKDDGFADALARGDDQYCGMPTRYVDLERAVARNPVAAETVFTMLVEGVTDGLLGCRLERTMKTTPVGVLGGALGPCHVVCGCIEYQNRGSLHVHLAIMSGAITPRLMENTAAYPMFRKKVVAVMDSMYKAGVGLEAHVTHLVTNHDGAYAPRHACTECPDPVMILKGIRRGWKATW